MNATMKQWKGRIKQAVGSLTGNKKLEREGKADRVSAEVDEQLTHAKDKVGEAVDRAARAAKGALGVGEGRSRRKQRRASR